MLTMMILLLIFACIQPPAPAEAPMNISGFWSATNTSYIDGFEIDLASSPPALFYYSEVSTDTLGFAGEIVNDVTADAASGTILYKVTDGGLYDLTVDQYSVMLYTDFDGKTCKAGCSPWKSGYPSTKDKTSDALNEFTVANGYFYPSFFGIYKK
jgi:hypothetical protein